MKITGFEFNLFGVNTYVTWDPEYLSLIHISEPTRPY